MIETLILAAVGVIVTGYIVTLNARLKRIEASQMRNGKSADMAMARHDASVERLQVALAEIGILLKRLAKPLPKARKSVTLNDAAKLAVK